MTRLYLAGPMSGYPEKNYPAFHAEAARLRALGYAVVSPAEINTEDGLPWAHYMRIDIPLLLTCDEVTTLPRYDRSKGAMLEVHIALELGMVVAASKHYLHRDPTPCRPPVDFSDIDDDTLTATAGATDWAAA